MTGFTTTWASGLPHQSRICSTVIGVRVFSNRPSPPASPRIAASERCTCRTTCRGFRAGVEPVFVVGAVEVEGQLASGDRTQSLGAAYVQRLGRPERLQRLSTLGHGRVEVEGISHIQSAPDVGVPVEAGAGLPDVERPAVRGGLAAPLGLLGHELGDRGLDQPVELADAEPVRKRRDPGIHERERPPSRATRWPWRSTSPSTPPGHRPRPASRPAGAGSAARPPHPGRPCPPRSRARPRPRTQ